MAEQDTRHETRSLGPGKGGADDYVIVRLNSMAMLVLYAWLGTALVLLLPDLSHRAITGWLRHPLNTVMMVLLIGMSFWHVKYGLDELIDDYVHTPVNRMLAVAAEYTFTIVGALYAILCVLRVVLTPE